MHTDRADMPSACHLPWGAQALWQQLTPLLPELSVEVVARLDSTNTELLERLRRQAETQPCLLVAEHQTRGRGRQGKAWLASPGASLTFSLALPMAPTDWSGLSLAVGLAVAETFDPQPPGGTPRLGIKWPNDLLLMAPAATGGVATGTATTTATATSALGRKLGGILIETVQVGAKRMAVVGIGLNVLPRPDDAAERALSWGYACLQELECGLTAPAALARLALPLVRSLQAFERDGFASLRERFAARDVLLGKPVTTTLPDLPAGTADGVDATGTLWLQVAGQRRPVASGEVSLRPAPESGHVAGGHGEAPC